jgi:two-component system NarL family sensor kinase
MLTHQNADRKPSYHELERLIQERAFALRSLSARLLRVQDEERRHLARELHDSTGQTLTALKLQLARLKEYLKQEEYSLEILASADALATQALEEIRTTSYLLYPPLLHEAGLASAAQWFIDGFAKRSHVRVRLSFGSGIQHLQKTTETALFRVLQESLTNIYRHSDSLVADVRLGQHHGMVTLEVQDYGKGIPHAVLDKFKQTGAGGGVGLCGMKDRIEDCCGRLEMISGPQGTVIRATVPLRFTHGSDSSTESVDAAAV